MEDLVQGIFSGFSGLFASMFDAAPMLWGSKYPMFLLFSLMLIIVFDLVVFGWRPLMKKYAPDAYGSVDYYFTQSMNVLALLMLVGLTFFLGAVFGDTWGVFLGLSGLVWMTAGTLVVIFGGRYLTNMGRMKK